MRYMPYDAQLHAPAAKANEVLEAGGSICRGKANLLAVLLRANGIPSGISYQILTKGIRLIRDIHRYGPRPEH